MKTIIITITLSLFGTLSAHASCLGSGSFRTCTDESGNSYTTSRVGNSTFTNGYNANTGSTWNEDTYKSGNTTYINGRDADGDSWNETITHYGSTTTYSGSDSDGNSFYKSCNQFGCY